MKNISTEENTHGERGDEAPSPSPVVVDLFAGCGGFSLGMRLAGFDVTAAFELWEAAAKIHERNLGCPVLRKDLSDTKDAIALVSAYAPDILIGGPPCQDFSSAGKRIEGARASLTECFAQIVAGVRPKGFVMENVRDVQKSRAYAAARQIYRNAGYGLTETVLDASLCGAPQKRKRFFCIGILGREDGAAADIIANGLSSEPMTPRRYFGDALGFTYYYNHARNYQRRAVFAIDEPAPTLRGMCRPLPVQYRWHPQDACRDAAHIHNLTTRDRARLQTFPDWFSFEEAAKADANQMIGNAVPPELARFVGLVVSAAMYGKTTKAQGLRPVWAIGKDEGADP